MECLRCGSKLTKGHVNTPIKILTGPNESELIIDGEIVTARSAYVCDRCGYIELSNKEFDAEEDNYEYHTFVN